MAHIKKLNFKGRPHTNFKDIFYSPHTGDGDDQTKVILELPKFTVNESSISNTLATLAT